MLEGSIVALKRYNRYVPSYRKNYKILPSAQSLLLRPSSTAALPQSSPWLCIPLFPRPARSNPCSSVRTVSNPKMTGTPASSWTRMSPWLTASAIYSKCIVAPLMRTPMAMIASKGFFGLAALAEPVTSAVGEDRRSVALMPWTEELAWSWEAA